VRNPEAESFFLARSARDEVGTLLIDSLKPLGEYELRGDLRVYKSPYAVTRDTVFCGASGMTHTHWRLDAKDRAIALATGAEPCEIGPDWVRFEHWRPAWPKVDVAHWALRAYVFAREGGPAASSVSPPPGPYEADEICLHLDVDGSATTYEATQTFWEKLSRGGLPQLGRGRLASFADFAQDWTTWEMHPVGEEIVMLLSGSVEFVLAQDGQAEQRVLLERCGQFVIVPRGAWHTANVRGASRMFFITPGEGTQHKPRS
jgi:mannose-6-phosphate isomerase-like protein (cupin superfamily)